MGEGHAVSVPAGPFGIAGGRLEVHQVPAGRDNLVWVIAAPAHGEAAIVDGPDAEGALALCDARGWRVAAVLNTHTHGDHVGVNRDLARRGRLGGVRVVGPARAAAGVPGLTEAVDEGDRVALWGVAMEVLRTEGHLDGHVSYVVGEALFCGDTLFGAGCGYLFDGPAAKMHASLARLAALAGETLVCCAHEYTWDNLRFAWSVEPDNAALAERIRAARVARAAGRSLVPSTVALERATNPFLRGEVPTLRAAAAAALGRCDTDRLDGLAVFTALRALKDTGAYRAIADGAMPG